jgi:hypothetical protein
VTPAGSEARIRQESTDLAGGDWNDQSRMNRLGAERQKLAAKLQPLKVEYFNRGQ